MRNEDSSGDWAYELAHREGMKVIQGHNKIPTSAWEEGDTILSQYFGTEDEVRGCLNIFYL